MQIYHLYRQCQSNSTVGQVYHNYQHNNSSSSSSMLACRHLCQLSNYPTCIPNTTRTTPIARYHIDQATTYQSKVPWPTSKPLPPVFTYVSTLRRLYSTTQTNIHPRAQEKPSAEHSTIHSTAATRPRTRRTKPLLKKGAQKWRLHAIDNTQVRRNKRPRVEMQ
jgi:hypothetical protein